MKILTLNTCFSSFSIALANSQEIIAKYKNKTPHKQAEELVSSITNVLEDTGIGHHSLDCIAATIGPGSFTGIRTGLAAANAIASITKTPLVGITTLEAIAFQFINSSKNVDKENRILVLINALKNEFYYQAFEVRNSLLKPLNTPSLNNFEELENIVDKNIVDDTQKKGLTVIGNCYQLINDKVINKTEHVAADINIDAAYLTPLAIEKFEKGNTDSCLSPFYLRKPDAKISKKVNAIAD